MSDDNQKGVGLPSNSLLLPFIAISRFKWILELFRTPTSAIGTIIVLVFLYLALFGTNVAPYAYDDDSFTNLELTPDTAPDCFSDTSIKVPILGIRSRFFDPFGTECKNPLGTDRLGRDIYSRVILGTREIFRLAGFGTLFSVIIGTAIGLYTGYRGGIIDEVISRLLDSLLSMPALLLALILVGTLPREPISISYPSLSSFSPTMLGLEVTSLELTQIHVGSYAYAVTIPYVFFESSFFKTLIYEIDMAKNSVLFVLTIVYAPIVARVVRSNVLSLKTRGFVEAAQLRGESTFYILWREILPSVIPTLVVEASLRFSYSIFLVASLSYLGLGTDPTIPNWGRMVSEASSNEDHICRPIATGETICPSWTLLYPALTIVILVISVNLMSDGIKRLVQRNE
jgi:ABC-type dipeptide/oligopeptide/nickel transport system permease subunit